MICDGCDKERRDVVACGRDGNGEPDAPCLCFICRAEGGRGRVFDRKAGRYVNAAERAFLRDVAFTEANLPRP